MKVLRVEFPWYSEVSSVITRNVIDDLDNAFKNFFRSVKKGEKPGYPKPKKRGVKDRFAIRDAAKFDVKNKTNRLTHIYPSFQLLNS